ncbi:hypothetical protein BGZ95_003176, partial [Linnemannia exigua]
CNESTSFITVLAPVFVMSTDTSNDHDKSASSLTETGGEGEPKYNQEHPHASQSVGSWKEALTRLDSVDSYVLMYMRNCIRLPDVDYEGFLYHADMTKENLRPIVRPIPFSAARTPPIDRGSGSSSPTSSPPHFSLFDVNSGDNEQDRDDVVDEGVALRHALHEDQVDATGDINLVHFQELNRKINWSSGTINVLVRFDLFVNQQGSSDYSLAKDR